MEPAKKTWIDAIRVNIYQYLTLQELACKIALLSVKERELLESCVYLQPEEVAQKRPFNFAINDQEREINLRSLDYWAKLSTEVHVSVTSGNKHTFSPLEYLMMHHSKKIMRGSLKIYECLLPDELKRLLSAKSLRLVKRVFINQSTDWRNDQGAFCSHMPELDQVDLVIHY